MADCAFAQTAIQNKKIKAAARKIFARRGFLECYADCFDPLNIF